MSNGQDATVSALYRYPVKSMQGQAVESLVVGPSGIEGDRTHALVHRDSGKLLSAKRYGKLLMASVGDGMITLDDGQVLSLTGRDTDAALSAWLGTAVTVQQASGTAGLEYEMTFDPPDDDAEYVAIPVPPGTFLDLAPVHLIGHATLDLLAAERPDLDLDIRRFRPNVVVSGLPPFGEDTLAGRQLRVGTAVLEVSQPTVRCAMPLRAQPGLERQAELFKFLSDRHDYHLGVYADVVTPGPVTLGDPVAVP